jgi:hypothetical protein
MKQTIEFAASLLVLSGWVLPFVRLFVGARKERNRAYLGEMRLQADRHRRQLS